MKRLFNARKANLIQAVLLLLLAIPDTPSFAAESSAPWDLNQLSVEIGDVDIEIPRMHNAFHPYIIY
jgi:hypothetical protein